MAAATVHVKLKAENGDYVIDSVDPPGWKDMIDMFVKHDPLFLGIEIGKNLDEGILFDFEIEA